MDKKAPLIDELGKAAMLPLWDRYMTLLTREPAPADWPISWSWNALQPLIERCADEVGMADAERRVLLMAHPAFAPHPYTTTNLSGALQVLLPGEHADAHRHTVSALRFVIEGSGAATWVNGERCEMTEGDLILTPSWCWHEHRNEGDRRVVWFDGLDLPLAHHLKSVFLEFGHGEARPAPVSDLPAVDAAAPAGVVAASGQQRWARYRYSGAAISATLDEMTEQADGTRTLRYLNPTTGRAVMPTLDCYAMRLKANATTRACRSTSNAVAIVARGSGTSQIGDQTISWSKNDVFTIPHWHWVTHRANDPDTQLFLMTDIGLLDAMGYLVTEYE